MEFNVVPIPPAIASTIRSDRISPQYNHPVSSAVASGYGPCRSCLHTFRAGEESRLLATYNPFAGLGILAAPGPIFVHEDECVPFAGDGFPPDLRSVPLRFEAYRADGSISAARSVDGDAVERAVDEMLSEKDVSFVHVRNAEAGCFIARIERRA